MGFMDKVKSAAQDVTKEAKKATATAQSKVEQGQLRKKMDEAAKKLGYLVYRERSQGTPAGAEADQLVSEIAGFEAELARQETAATPQSATGMPASPPEPSAAETPSTSASEPSPGDFKL